jgi:hypothetical protein
LLPAGCAARGDKLPAQARDALTKANRFELFSLDPNQKREKPGEGFHGWEVLGTTAVEDAGIRQKIVAALEKGVQENQGVAAECFNPRHGIRATRGDQTTDFVICFECLQVEVYVGDKRTNSFLVSRSPQPLFDKILRDAGVPLPAKSH